MPAVRRKELWQSAAMCYYWKVLLWVMILVCWKNDEGSERRRRCSRTRQAKQASSPPRHHTDSTHLSSATRRPELDGDARPIAEHLPCPAPSPITKHQSSVNPSLSASLVSIKTVARRMVKMMHAAAHVRLVRLMRAIAAVLAMVADGVAYEASHFITYTRTSLCASLTHTPRPLHTRQTLPPAPSPSHILGILSSCSCRIDGHPGRDHKTHAPLSADPCSPPPPPP